MTDHDTPQANLPLTAREASEALRREEGLPAGTIAALRASLSPEQEERIAAKQQYEHCSWLGVLADWPSLFEAES